MKLRTRLLPTNWLAWTWVFFGALGSLSANVIYVDGSAAGANNGSSWADAYTDLQDALSIASAGDEIWIAEGVYTPSVIVDMQGGDGGPDPREATFQIPDGVMLYGGFAGGEASPEARNWEAHLTILSGDIDHNDLNADGNHIAENTAELVGANAYHVIVTQIVSNTTGIDGIIVTAGYANNGGVPGAHPNNYGGGWHDKNGPQGTGSNLTIRNAKFKGNYAQGGGGALSLGFEYKGYLSHELHMSHTQFSGNEAHHGGALFIEETTVSMDSSLFVNNQALNPAPGAGHGSGALGGAIYLRGSMGQFHHCMFIQNSATAYSTEVEAGGRGGAIYLYYSAVMDISDTPREVEFLNCGFFQNSVAGSDWAEGGAILTSCYKGVLQVDVNGCVFGENTSTETGGAIANYADHLGSYPGGQIPSSIVNAVNSTFYGNAAGERGGAIANYGHFLFGFVNMLETHLVNCVLYGDEAGIEGAEIYQDYVAINEVSYSDIEGSGGSGPGWDAALGIDGGNNIEVNPNFVNAGDPLGPDGIGGTSDDGLQLVGGIPASAAVDGGNDWAILLFPDGQEITGEARVIGDAIDMGAYETYATQLGWKPVGLKVVEWNREIPPTQAWTLVLDPQTPNPQGEEAGSRFRWVEPGTFTDYKEYAVLEGVIADMNNSEAQFAVYLKLVNPHTWSEWKGKGRGYEVQSQAAQRTAQRSHEDWTYWELSPGSTLTGRGDVSGILRLSPASLRTGFQLGAGGNALDVDLGLGGKFKYSGRVSYDSAESQVKGTGSIHMDIEKEE